MSQIKYLLRSPLKLLLLLLLLTASLGFFCLGAGVWAGADATARKIDEDFVTLAVPKRSETRFEDTEWGRSWTVEEGLPEELFAALESMKGTGPVKEIYRQSYINGYGPGLKALTPYSTGKINTDPAHDGGVYVIEVESLEELKENPYDDIGGGSLGVQARVLECLAAHPDLMGCTQAGVLFDCSYAGGLERIKSLGLEKGKRFIINASGLMDMDRYLKDDIASVLGISPEEVDFSKISYELPEDVLKSMRQQGTPETELPVAVYDDRLYLDQHDVDSIGRYKIIVQDFYGSYAALEVAFSIMFPGEDFVLEGEHPLEKRYLKAFAEELSGDSGAFLASHPDWQAAVKEKERRRGTVGIIGTDKLEALYSFQNGEAKLVEGRSFTREEAERGEKLVVISEVLASESGLKVGDTVDLSAYWGSMKDIYRLDLAMQGLEQQPYSEAVGLEGEGASYRIAGLYRLENRWPEGLYSFNINTVFMPVAALPAEGFQCTDGLFVSVVLKNGETESFRQALKEAGYGEDSFVYYDRGYAGLAESLKSFRESSRRLLLGGAAVLIAAAVLYTALYVAGQRYELGLMRALGAGDGESFRQMTLRCLIPVLASALLGALLAMLLMDRLQRGLLKGAGNGTAEGGLLAASEHLAAVPAAPLLSAAAAILFFALSVALTLLIQGRRSPARLLRRG